MTHAEPDWEATLEGCDFELARNEIAEMLSLFHKDAERKGGYYAWKKELASAIEAFLANPSLESAISLLNCAPSLFFYFEVAKPRGHPIFRLAGAIITSACSCAEALRPFMSFQTEKENRNNWFYVVFEFLYFFMHLTNRCAHGILGPDKAALQEWVGPPIVHSVIEGFFGHWPDDLKEGIQAEFYEKLNESELEYAECRGLIPEDRPLTGNSLLATLARNVAELLNDPMNPVTLTEIQCVAAEAFAKMDRDELVKTAGESLEP